MILFFTKTNSGGTDDVWFYDVQADGFSLDDKRAPVKANDLPDVLKRWTTLRGDDEQAAKIERERARTEQSFCVPKSEIAEQGYDLSLNRYKEIQYEEVEYRSPTEIIAELGGRHVQRLVVGGTVGDHRCGPAVGIADATGERGGHRI